MTIWPESSGKCARNSVQHAALAGAVGADDDAKITGSQLQAEAVESDLLVGLALVENLARRLDFEHPPLPENATAPEAPLQDARSKG
jgi:hypothetical protein